MRTLLLIPTLFLSVCIIQGCSGSKAMSKRASKLQAAGLYKEAAEGFLNALSRNPKNIDAKIGLKGSGQRVVNDLSSTFYQAHQSGRSKEAVYAFLDAQNFIEKTSRFVEFKLPPYYDEYYETSRDKYLGEVYVEANDLLDQEAFSQAEERLMEIQRIDANYKDVGELLDYSTIEPLYRSGIASMEAKRYREAYQRFTDVVHRKGAYKEAVQYKEKALKEAQLTVAILPTEGQRKWPTIENAIATSLVQNLVNSRNPFIKVVDRQHIERVLKEQHLGLSGLVDEKNAASAGELLGAKLLFTGEVIGVSSNPGKPKSYKRTGYKSYQVEQKNAEGETIKVTKYSKVMYTEVIGESRISCSYQFQLISAETGEVILSEVLSSVEVDQVNYAKFDGRNRDLYPGTWKQINRDSPEDHVDTDRNAKRELDRLLSNEARGLRDTEQMKLEVIRELGEKVSVMVNAYNPEQ